MAEKSKKKTENKEEEIKETTEETIEETIDETVEEKIQETVQSIEDKLKEKVKELEDKYLRLYAEFDNFKKRTIREKDARYADAVIDTTAQFLAVADNLERALQTEVESEDAKKLYEGVAMTYKQMQECLEKLNVKEIKALGEQFDPNLHNAVMHVEDEAVDENTIVEEFLKGYIYNDSRVVRHSMVKVAN